MERYALLGWPVRHSVSPQMQGAGFRALGIEATYELIEVAPPDLDACVRRLRAEGYAGWNVTVPHKEAMAERMDAVDPAARAARSVNTVLHRGGRLCGHSTDGYGLAAAIRESFGIGIPGGRFLFLGAGGAARAASVAFACQGAAEIQIANRTIGKAEDVVRIIAEVAPHCRAAAFRPDDRAALAAAMARAQCLVQATSLGLHPGEPMPCDPACLPGTLAVMDMVYGGTPFLAAAARRGCPTADGRGMLLHQGVRSFEIWTGRPAPVAAMRRGLEEALEERRRRQAVEAAGDKHA
ncbi:MAG: shikimate dehydrogenase [Lentisphaeria bacterium]|nr:shikimate dehydrogenase [Lentisphaeria bacterium]